jgi:hypothetical protein
MAFGCITELLLPVTEDLLGGQTSTAKWIRHDYALHVTHHA